MPITRTTLSTYATQPLNVILALALALASGCSGGGQDPSPDAMVWQDAQITVDASIVAPVAPDPLDLADEVDPQQLETNIQELEDLGTRYTFSAGDELARDHLVARLEAMGLTPELDPFTVQGEAVDNIIVRQPGVEDPDVIYIFSAHYDSTSETPDTYAPGADDNASGVAAVLEAARILTPLNFKYSLWYVFTAAEEQGAMGAQHMVSWLTAQGLDVRGVIAPDMIGYWPLGDGDSLDILGDSQSEHLVNHMADMADQLGVAYKLWIQHGYCYGDDHTYFQEAGFPAITPMDCVEAHNVAASGESLPHYHKATDTVGTLHLPFTALVTGTIVATFASLGEPLP